MISFFKILKYSFEIRDINANFLKDNFLFLRHFDEKFELNYISSRFMKIFAFYLFDYPWIQTVVLYDSTFEICFVYKRKCEDMMFCDLKF